MAFLYIDLDRFKQVIDDYGHIPGDEVLKVFASRIKQHLRESDTSGRIGGDEFILTLTEVKEYESVRKYCQRIQDVTEEPIFFEDKKLSFGVSIGIAIYPDDGKTVDDLRKKADKAMYKVKGKGRRG